ncbi:unnamed protein product [Penicillium camemberti]|uniref:Str. FM013 n=1 Tax=Penicillium camemberti (strain FM 013) TaxID=1429867 RepID=A0A0G4P135_PENC3|nr:unnamed protein product [Penicillium camemberti]
MSSSLILLQTPSLRSNPPVALTFFSTSTYLITGELGFLGLSTGSHKPETESMIQSILFLERLGATIHFLAIYISYLSAIWNVR